MNSTKRETNDHRPECVNIRTRDRAPRVRPTPDGFEQRLLIRARAQQFQRGECIVVGFSGGRDSLALAAALRRVRSALGVEPLLVHIDHRLRPSSNEERVRAAALAADLGLHFRALSAPAPLLQHHPHLGVEEAARRERYRLLGEAALEAGAHTIATAHQREDQAETVLLHLFHGSGVHGASAMSEQAAVPFPFPSAKSDISQETAIISLWRPLLQEPRRSIDRYVARLGLAWIEDSSNDDVSLRRNAVRHRILPLLEHHFPGAAAALARYASLAAADDEALDHLAAAAIPEVVDPGGRLTAAALVEKPLALQRRVVRRWIVDTTGLTTITAERTDAVIGLAAAGEGTPTIEIGDHWTVHREQGMLHLSNVNVKRLDQDQ